MRETDLSLTSIAHKVGYEGLPAFSRAFKAHVGSPPAVWRASIVGNH
jgi:AraC-like DNA-binding protein